MNFKKLYKTDVTGLWPQNNFNIWPNYKDNVLTVQKKTPQISMQFHIMYPWNAAEFTVNMPFLRTQCIFSHKVKTYREGRCDSIWLDYYKPI